MSFCFSRTSVISIPIGAVKSGAGTFYLERVGQFQFQSVRLKDRFTSSLLAFWRISIPIGAVKSRGT